MFVRNTHGRRDGLADFIAAGGDDRAGRHDVDANALRCQFLGEGFRPVVERGLGGSVMRHRATEGDTAAGGDVDDRAFGFQQFGDHRVGDAQRGQEVDVNAVDPFLVRDRGRGRQMDAGGAGAVDQDVEAAELGDRILGDLLRAGQGARVAGNEGRALRGFGVGFARGDDDRCAAVKQVSRN